MTGLDRRADVGGRLHPVGLGPPQLLVEGEAAAVTRPTLLRGQTPARARLARVSETVGRFAVRGGYGYADRPDELTDQGQSQHRAVNKRPEEATHTAAQSAPPEVEDKTCSIPAFTWGPTATLSPLRLRHFVNTSVNRQQCTQAKDGDGKVGAVGGGYFHHLQTRGNAGKGRRSSRRERQDLREGQASGDLQVLTGQQVLI